MKDDELSMLLSKFASNHHIRQLSVIIESSSRFRAFAQANSKKIGKKIRDAAKDKAVLDEKLSDVYFEIFAAHLFLQQNFVSEVIYEKYGEKGESAPDYTVHCRNGLAFNAEVKRIRAVCLKRQFEAWEDKIKQFIRSIESPLAIKLVFNDRQGCFLLKYENDLVDRLENHLNNRHFQYLS